MVFTTEGFFEVAIESCLKAVNSFCKKVHLRCVTVFCSEYISPLFSRALRLEVVYKTSSFALSQPFLLYFTVFPACIYY